MSGGLLIGREPERARLEAALVTASAGEGSLLLLSGEAGVGKTRLAETVLVGGDSRFVRGAATPAGSPYGPVTAAFREFLRAEPQGLDGCGPLRNRLALLLPELGASDASGDRATLVEAIRCGLESVVAGKPAAMLLDDLQWSDEATLELLSALAVPLREIPLLVIAAYRSDELPRSHPLRRLRNDLRRDRALEEITVEPLTEPETALLVEQLAGATPSPRLAQMLHDRTGGTPFFVEELTSALDAAGRLQPGATAWSSRSTTTSRCRAPCVTRFWCKPRRCPSRHARPPRLPRSPEHGSSWRCSTSSAWTTALQRSCPSAWCSSRSRASPRSGIRSRATRSTRTSAGCAGARCTAASPKC